MRDWKLLVVDDHEINLKIIQEYLDLGPFKLTTAMDGAKAWQSLNSPDISFDLIILDRMMPEMDGMQLLRKIKSDERLKDTPVIMQTAAASPEQIREGMEAGCYYYLTKPYAEDALLGVVYAALDELRQRLELDSALADMSEVPVIENATFTYRTPHEAMRLSAMLAVSSPAPAIASMGLSELLLNAIEHGNLELSYEDKKKAKLAGTWDDEVAARLEDPRFVARRASVTLNKTQTAFTYTITDEGQGFDWQPYLECDAGRAFDPNGRGIAMSRKMAFSSLEYRLGGRQVVATVTLKDPSA